MQGHERESSIDREQERGRVKIKSILKKRPLLHHSHSLGSTAASDITDSTYCFSSTGQRGAQSCERKSILKKRDSTNTTTNTFVSSSSSSSIGSGSSWSSSGCYSGISIGGGADSGEKLKSTTQQQERKPRPILKRNSLDSGQSIDHSLISSLKLSSTPSQSNCSRAFDRTRRARSISSSTLGTAPMICPVTNVVTFSTTEPLSSTTISINSPPIETTRIIPNKNNDDNCDKKDDANKCIVYDYIIYPPHNPSQSNDTQIVNKQSRSPLGRHGQTQKSSSFSSCSSSSSPSPSFSSASFSSPSFSSSSSTSSSCILSSTSNLNQRRFRSKSVNCGDERELVHEHNGPLIIKSSNSLKSQSNDSIQIISSAHSQGQSTRETSQGKACVKFDQIECKNNFIICDPNEPVVVDDSNNGTIHTFNFNDNFNEPCCCYNDCECEYEGRKNLRIHHPPGTHFQVDTLVVELAADRLAKEQMERNNRVQNTNSGSGDQLLNTSSCNLIDRGRARGQSVSSLSSSSLRSSLSATPTYGTESCAHSSPSHSHSSSSSRCCLSSPTHLSVISNANEKPLNPILKNSRRSMDENSLFSSSSDNQNSSVSNITPVRPILKKYSLG